MRSLRRGFTVLELMLAVGIGAVALSTVVPITARFRHTQELESAAQSILYSGLRFAQARALKYDQDSSWGVYFDHSAPRYVVFAGESYAARAVTFDRETRLIGDLTLTGTVEIVFDKGTGKTAGGSVTVTNSAGSRTITIGSEGTAEVPPPSSSSSSSVATEDDIDLSIFAEP